MVQDRSSDARIAVATDALRQIRDAMLAITNAGPDMPTAAIRSVAWLVARRADEAIAELAS